MALELTTSFGSGTAFRVQDIFARIEDGGHVNAYNDIVLDGTRYGANITGANAIKPAAFANIAPQILPRRVADTATQRDGQSGVFVTAECTDEVVRMHVRYQAAANATPTVQVTVISRHEFGAASAVVDA